MTKLCAIRSYSILNIFHIIQHLKLQNDQNDRSFALKHVHFLCGKQFFNMFLMGFELILLEQLLQVEAATTATFLGDGANCLGAQWMA